MLRVTKAESLLIDTVSQLDGNIRAGVDQSLRQAQISPELVPEVKRVTDAILPKVIQKAQEQLSWERMKPQYIQMYRETFTQEEIDGMITFYKTPSGQSVINKMPLLMQKLMVMTQQVIMPLVGQMQVDLKNAIAAVKESRQSK